MSKPVVLLDDAENDLERIHDAYEEIVAGLGDRFARQVNEVIDRISEFPTPFAVVKFDVRVAAVPKFPYMILHRVVGECVEVFAIVHNSRGPQYLQSRI